ncbi:hypothetical protein SUGI_0704130 [Cryptomeria japonica]|uniref:uncharacterized protein LOC131856606 n=1 Tax=Cryptomeria japonica TaxID=3369 RepID=UPI002414A8D5|nr:uncharacterized protein LOC131856606 [Cryptomeria japonica]XP_059064434.1 uncharacterized protein LOC131856607 [Cryptomeria japonica]GLJ34979.1 hypothetical protein SUGI_0704030 [Cryptomeria japonica]GLJ34988.1 hypothetical protein SUGI_0704130 [Cryptomeria japonica]
MNSMQFNISIAPIYMIEVYDNHSWKAGRVLKVLPGRLFVVKLMESLLERTYHLSVIRVQLFWESERWLHNNVEAGRDHFLKMGFWLKKKSHFENQFLEFNKKANAGFTEHEHDEPNKLGTKYLKRKAGNEVPCGYQADILKTEDASEERSAAKKFRYQELVAQSVLPVLKKVDPISSRKKIVREEYLCMSPSTCSSNELDYVLYSDKKNSKQSSNESHFDDPQSPCECANSRQNDFFPENEVDCRIHELEITAYRSTMRAFYASGCLTWGPETLLTDLRHELHISDDEHSSELSRLCSRKAL